MKAVIYLDVPEWQIGQDVTVYFPDTMLKHGKCELLEEHESNDPTLSWNEMIHPDEEALAKRNAFLSDENGKKLQEMIDQINLMEEIMSDD